MSLVGCQRPRVPASDRGARAEILSNLALCAFDGVQAFADERTIEAAMRREIRARRMAFAERTGRCITALDDATSPALRALNDAWVELLQRVQSRDPDDLALERAIRHVGNAWHDARR